MTSAAGRGWVRTKGSLADRLAFRMQDHSVREEEILRQLTDVFKEISRLSAEVADATKRLAELADTVALQIDLENQSTELLGRLLAQARARLDALEEAGPKA